MAFVRAIVRAFERYGVDPAGALRAGQIPLAEVSRPGARITARQMELLSGAAMQELDDEALGWFSRRLPWGSYGMLCRASITAPSLGVALRRWCRHHGLLTDDVLLELGASGPAATLSIEERRQFGELREFCLVTLLRYVHGYACWAVDSRIPLVEAAFPFQPPPHADVYPLLFPGPVAFGAARAGFRFDARYLALVEDLDSHRLGVVGGHDDLGGAFGLDDVVEGLPLRAHPARRLCRDLHLLSPSDPFTAGSCPLRLYGVSFTA